MIVLGIDLGSSSVKVSLLDAATGYRISNASFPPEEMEIISIQNDWAEQDPNVWMSHLRKAILMLRERSPKELKLAKAIGISYQMHGLVVVDKEGIPLRNAIIWCDSRAVEIGRNAFNELGQEYCLCHFLNSPGNFTASKLKWVKENEPELYEKIDKIMLPGDYIAYRLTNRICTTSSGLSEGIFWDFQNNQLSDELLDYYGFSKEMIPEIVDTFSEQGKLSSDIAADLGMTAGIPIAYRAGDQPNNALSLNVLQAGSVAATAGTSGVVYGVIDKKDFDPKSRVNTFLHVNNHMDRPRLGILLNLNSVGILNSWARKNLMNQSVSYTEMNQLASQAAEGSEGLLVLPFGNGAERMLENRNIGAGFYGLNLIKHQHSHLLRAIQEGIVFAFNYGLDIMKSLGLNLNVIRAGQANMFLSSLFVQSLSNLSGAQIELYNTDGAEGAARGAAIGSSYFKTADEAFDGLKILKSFEPQQQSQMHEYYQNWLEILEKQIKEI